MLSSQIKENISWRNIIFHKKKLKEVRIRAHMLSYCNSTMIVLKRIGKKGQFILKLKKIIENRLITYAAIQK